MQLPSRTTMLDAAAHGDWRAVLGLTFFQTLTPREARNLRAQVHPDRGGDAQVAALVGQALDEIPQGGAPSAPQPEPDTQSDDFYMGLARQILEWTRKADQNARDAISNLHDAIKAKYWRDVESIRRIHVGNMYFRFRSVNPEPYLERARREEEASAEFERQVREEDARVEQERRARREQEVLQRERERQQREERERAAEPAPTPEDRSTARKRRLTEAARERRQRARPSQTQVADVIARLCVTCSLEEASPIKSVREALRAAGCNLTEQRTLLDSSYRRQRGTGADRVYYLMYDFGRGLKPIRLR